MFEIQTKEQQFYIFRCLVCWLSWLKMKKNSTRIHAHINIDTREILLKLQISEPVCIGCTQYNNGTSAAAVLCFRMRQYRRKKNKKKGKKWKIKCITVLHMLYVLICEIKKKKTSQICTAVYVPKSNSNSSTHTTPIPCASLSLVLMTGLKYSSHRIASHPFPIHLWQTKM